jgi:hypothetical protein
MERGLRAPSCPSGRISWSNRRLTHEPSHPAIASTELSAVPLRVREHPTTDELAARYCAERTDGMRPFTTERLIFAGA